jgi:hypothetical protein
MKRKMKRGEISIGGDWVLQRGAQFPFRNLSENRKANFDCRPVALKRQFPVKEVTNIFCYGCRDFIPQFGEVK